MMPHTDSSSPDSKLNVLITGCSSGLGHALALQFVQAGYPTYATARNPESITDLAEAGCTTMALDVTDTNAIQQAVSRVEQDHGSVGILINNAAIGLMSPMEIIPLDVVRQQYETNVFGLLAMTQAVLPAMRNAGFGRVVNIGSSGGEWTTPAGGIYQATKYTVDSMSDAMRMELKPFGIKVVLIEPGAIASKFATNGVLLMDENGPYEQMMRGVEQITSKAVQSGAPGTWSPEQVANVVFKAATTKRPKTRYRVGFVSKLMIKLSKWLPDRAWDYMFMSSLHRLGKNHLQ